MAADGDFESGLAALEAGRFDEAAATFAAILGDRPDDPGALHYLGLARHRLGDNEAAAALIERSLAVAPDRPAALSNLGNVYRALGRTEEAEAAFWAAIRLDLGNVGAWTNLAIVERERGERQRAAKALSIARLFDPDHFPAKHMSGLVHSELGDHDAAAEMFRACTAVEDPHFKPALPIFYAGILNKAGRDEAALSVLEAWLAADPDNPRARFHVAAQRGRGGERAPDAYVRSTFDAFADTFDNVLDRLGYATPERIARCVAELAASRRIGRAVDLGCGTGRLGALIRTSVAHLTGVDLSPKMLEKARSRGVYDELVEAGVEQFLDAGPAGRLELAAAADTFPYIGDLAPAFAALARALAPGGVLVASFEALKGGDPAAGFRLLSSGRYAHDAAYLVAVAAAAGLSVTVSETVDLRSEMGAAVRGHVMSFAKNPG